MPGLSRIHYNDVTFPKMMDDALARQREEQAKHDAALRQEYRDGQRDMLVAVAGVVGGALGGVAVAWVLLRLIGY